MIFVIISIAVVVVVGIGVGRGCGGGGVVGGVVFFFRGSLTDCEEGGGSVFAFVVVGWGGHGERWVDVDGCWGGEGI